MTFRNKLVVLGLSIIVWAIPGQSATAPDKVEFKVLHQPEKIVRYKMVVKIVGSMKRSGPIPEQKTSQIIEQEYLSKCIKVNPDGSAVYEMSTPRFEVQTDFGGYKGTFSSDNTKPVTSVPSGPQTQPTKPDISPKLISAITQAKFTMTVGRDGAPLKVQGYTESLNKAIQKAGEFNPKDKIFLNILRQSMNDDLMLKEMKNRFGIFPPRRTIKIGDTWTSTSDMNMAIFNITTKIIAEYKVVGIEEFRGRPCIKVQSRESMQSSPLPKPASKPAASQPENPFDAVTLTLKTNEGSGSAYLDYQTGELVQYHKTQRMVTEANMKAPPGLKSDEFKNGITVRQSALTSFSLDLLPETPETTSPQK
jgi:hypothetical protein